MNAQKSVGGLNKICLFFKNSGVRKLLGSLAGLNLKASVGHLFRLG